MKKKLIFCQTKVNASGIKRENRDGVEHIIITSFTLPPNIVMNGGMYLETEVDKSFHSLERTLAPIEHPEVNGQFISASDPIAINNFYGGAWNENVEKIEDGRIKVEKVVNVQEALKSEKGKRLLDRISAMESGDDSRAIHTSVGVFLEMELLGEMQTNDAGDEFDWIARNMFFDHDAILLDSIGAATPSKGVGIGINKEKIDVEFVTCDMDGTEKLVLVKGTKINSDDLRTNKEISFGEIHEKLFDVLNAGITEFDKKSWIVAVFDETFIYETPSGELFRSAYSIDENGNIEISDTRLPVEKVVKFEPINPPEDSEDTTMRDEIIAELKKLGISVNAEISDADLMAKYNEAIIAANASDDENADDVDNPNVNSELAKTVKDQANQIADLTSKIEANANAEIDKKIKTIRACFKYSAISEASLRAIHTNSAEEFESMYIDSVPSVGIGLTSEFGGDDKDDKFKINTEVADLPE